MNILSRRRAILNSSVPLPPVPAGFYRYAYIEKPDNTSADRMIDTGVNGAYTTSRYKITCISMPVKLNSTNTGGIWGLRAGTGDANVPTARLQFYAKATNNAKTGGQYNGVNLGAGYNTPYNERCTYVTVGTEFWLNGKKIRDDVSGTFNPVTTQNIWLFGERRASTGYALNGVARIYEFSVFDTQENEWIAYLVPAIRISDWKVGMLDLISGAFKRPSSSVGVLLGLDNDPQFPRDPVCTTISTSLSTSAEIAQGSCYANGKIYSMAVTEPTTQELYSYDLSTGTLTLCATYSTLAHANSLSYNPTENVLYCATMDSSIGIAKISLVDYSLVSTKRIKNANGNYFTPWTIAYDRIHNVLYSQTDNTKIGVYDTDLEFQREIQLRNSPPHKTAQGLETDGYYFYIPFSAPTNQVDIYRLDGTLVAQENLSFSVEVEEVCYDWNNGFYLTAYSGTHGTFHLYSANLKNST